MAGTEAEELFLLSYYQIANLVSICQLVRFFRVRFVEV